LSFDYILNNKGCVRL